ncbi:MAG: hypothetical protein JWS10_1863 [Cypionkella sp.]|uniref:LysR substrate-binding domain-containing protein n=1 Tax=Cypionkella sp. TaxID=2811411 RepID=UPI002637917B|nr:LysR substrate-binding domain-containing protein [Cypionkella sp.]MDB5659248.1 hypothetical protein [Cypionkella sp.]
MPLKLPPLNALRAFEAAARTGSYVAAAEELGVSGAAISQHIRKLEEFMGKEMFVRMNNRVVLTDAGQSMFAGTADALQIISDVTGELMLDHSRSQLVISTIESVAEKWLLPRLAGYAHINPEFRFDLRVEPDPVDFARHNIDLRLGYGSGQYPDQQVILIARDTVQPMCSPSYLARNPSVRDQGMLAVPATDLLHTSWGVAFGSNPTWRSWYVKAGMKPPSDTGGIQVGRSGLAVDMARGGLGVALAQRMLAASDVTSGLLVPLSDVTLDLGHPYFLAHPHSKARKRSLLAVIAWITKASID